MSRASRTHSLSGRGTILGTLPYMSPEQLEGTDVDARTDIFAFGAVVYEMITGRRAFAANSQATLISSIMSADPPTASALQPLIPPALERVVRKCLEKIPRGDGRRPNLSDEIQWVDVARRETTSTSTVRVRTTARWAWTAALLSALIAVTFSVLLSRRPPAVAGEPVRFTLPLPTPGSTRDLEIRSEITDVAGAVARWALSGGCRGHERAKPALAATPRGGRIQLLPGTEGAFSRSGLRTAVSSALARRAS